MRRTAMTALAVALLAAACSSSGDTNPTSSTVPVPASSRPTAADDGVVPCSSFDGVPTVNVDEFFDQGNACGLDRGLTELEPAFLGINDLECVNGTYLYWNDAGWGPVPGTWTTSSKRTPPRDLLLACRGE